MKRTIAVAFVLVASGTLAAAQEEVPIKPKPPTAAQGKMLVADAVRTAQKLDEADSKVDEADKSLVAAQANIDAHNAVWPSGTCMAPADNPSACNGWVAEAGPLNAAKAAAIQEREKQRFQRATLRGHLNMRLARLRMMAILEGLSEWEKEVVACSKLKDAARGCLIAAWERHP